MISKTDILKMVRHVARHSQGQTERKATNPQREWFIGVGFFVGIAVVGSIFNAQDFVLYNNFDATVVDTATPVTNYNQFTATKAIEEYTRRLTRFTELTKMRALPSEASAAGTSANNDTESVVSESLNEEGTDERGLSEEEGLEPF